MSDETKNFFVRVEGLSGDSTQEGEAIPPRNPAPSYDDDITALIEGQLAPVQAQQASDEYQAMKTIIAYLQAQVDAIDNQEKAIKQGIASLVIANGYVVPKRWEKVITIANGKEWQYDDDKVLAHVIAVGEESLYKTSLAKTPLKAWLKKQTSADLEEIGASEEPKKTVSVRNVAHLSE